MRMKNLISFLQAPFHQPARADSGEYAAKIKQYLDEHYEVIIIDTPPFWYRCRCPDTWPWADVTLVVTRFAQTVKEQVAEINEWHDRNLSKHRTRF